MEALGTMFSAALFILVYAKSVIGADLYDTMNTSKNAASSIYNINPAEWNLTIVVGSISGNATRLTNELLLADVVLPQSFSADEMHVYNGYNGTEVAVIQVRKTCPLASGEKVLLLLSSVQSICEGTTLSCDHTNHCAIHGIRKKRNSAIYGDIGGKNNASSKRTTASTSTTTRTTSTSPSTSTTTTTTSTSITTSSTTTQKNEIGEQAALSGSTTPGSTPPGSTTPGSTPPGSTPPGSTTPGSTPGSTPPGSTPPGSTTPGSTPPGSTTPGSTPPGSTPPGSTTPGSTTPRSTTPGSTPPGSTPPGSTTPGSTTPGSTPPGSTTPGSTTPGSTPPGSTTPGSTTPGSTTPGSTTPGSTTPKADKMTPPTAVTPTTSTISTPLDVLVSPPILQLTQNETSTTISILPGEKPPLIVALWSYLLPIAAFAIICIAVVFYRICNQRLAAKLFYSKDGANEIMLQSDRKVICKHPVEDYC